jgi:hypothetical protein
MSAHRAAMGLAPGRSYLAAWLSDEDYWAESEPDSKEWFAALAEFILSLPLSDARLELAQRYLQPFLDDDERIGAALYPAGFAISYVETTSWGGEFATYLGGFLAALERDHALWARAVELDGSAAVWRFDHNLLDDTRLHRRGRWVYGPSEPDGGRSVTHVAAKRCGAALRGPRARGQTCGKIADHDGGHASTEAIEAAYVRAVAKRYPSGLYALRARLSDSERGVELRNEAERARRRSR